MSQPKLTEAQRRGIQDVVASAVQRVKPSVDSPTAALVMFSRMQRSLADGLANAGLIMTEAERNRFDVWCGFAP